MASHRIIRGRLFYLRKNREHVRLCLSDPRIVLPVRDRPRLDQVADNVIGLHLIEPSIGGNVRHLPPHVHPPGSEAVGPLAPAKPQHGLLDGMLEAFRPCAVTPAAPLRPDCDEGEGNIPPQGRKLAYGPPGVRESPENIVVDVGDEDESV